MTLLPAAIDALTGAAGRFERAGSRLLGAASGGDAGDAVTAMVDMIQARAQFRAATATIQFSNEMWDALLQISRDDSAR